MRRLKALEERACEGHGFERAGEQQPAQEDGGGLTLDREMLQDVIH